MENKAIVVSSNNEYKGKWVSINKDKIIKPNGTNAEHEIAIRGDCVLILAIDKGKVCLVKQFRYPANESLWELPTGFINLNESPKNAAIREFSEEVGLKPSKIKKIAKYWTWPGFSTQKVNVFLLTDFTKTKKKLDESESDLQHKFIKIETVFKMVKSGTIRSSVSIAALNYLL
ncbi:MAG: NUDIX hydrolase [Candidatus Shapirobacteria bacterium]|nr:NUDIX hydrolase [Candidatus Shapirobacteria bacterium]